VIVLDEEAKQILKEIKDALTATEAYLVYTDSNNTSAVENLLNTYGVKYHKRESLLSNLYEYLLTCREHTYQEIKNRILEQGVKAYAVKTRLPLSGTLGTINAVVEAAHLQGYDPNTSTWVDIHETSNALHVRLKAQDAGLAQESTLSSINGKIQSYNRGVKAIQLSVTTAAARVSGSNLYARTVVLQAPSGNTANILIGDSTAQYYELTPGKETPPLSEVNLYNLWAKAASGTQTLNIIATT
jgi:hypothetical protein